MHFGTELSLSTQSIILVSYVFLIIIIAETMNLLDFVQDMRREEHECCKLKVLADTNLTEEQSLELYRRTEELVPRLERITNIKKYL